MSIAQNIAKIGATVAGLGLVAGSFAMALPAAAQTTTTTTTSSSSASQSAALAAQIASLQAQLNAMQGTSASVTFTRDLTVGSTGSDVTALQTWLIAKGFSIPAGATGYFGAQTKAAVAAWQAANGISPAAGYFGPISRAAVAAAGGSTTTTTTVAGCAPGAAYSSTTGQACGTTTTTTGGSLSGGEGSINNLQVLGAPSNATVYQGQSQKVYGFQFQATGSDLAVNRVDFDLTNNAVAVNGGSGNDRPWATLQSATLYDGNNAIATVDASNGNNWSQDGTSIVNGHQTYRIRFDNLTDVVKMGNTAQYTVAFTAQNGISTANQTQYQVQLAPQGVRATDAMGLQQYSSAGAQNSTTFNVSNAAAGTVTISTASDNPQVSTQMANSSGSTQNVVLGAFTLQAQNAATNIYSLPVTLTVSGMDATHPNPVQDLKLVENGTVLASQAITSTQSYTVASNLSGAAASSTTVVFNNLNVTVPAGTTQEFTIQADINPVGGNVSGNSAEGAAVAVSITSGNLTASDVEQGNNRITSINGGLSGNAITFHVNGLSVDSTPTTSATVSNIGQSGTQNGTFTFTFNATAFGQDIYVASTSAAYTMAFNGSASGTPATTLTSTADKSALGNYVIHAGQTRQITVTGTVSGNNAYVYATLTALKYGTTDGATTANTITLPTSYQTQPVYIHS